MSLAVVYSRASQGIAAPLVTVEVHLASGLPNFTIVGLPATAVKESRDRVKSAIINCQFEFPVARIVVNLAPADLPKQGGRFDLAIAVGILAASGQIPLAELEKYEFAGELSLEGKLRGILGALPFAIATEQAGRQLFLSANNAAEATLSKSAKVLAAKHLLEVCAHLTQKNIIEPFQPNKTIAVKKFSDDLAEVKGQPNGKRALEIAAAGGHSLLLKGPPGSGKTMLAKRLNSILPLLSEAEALESAAVSSLTQQGFNIEEWRIRPFRTPHHTASSAALVGGGNPPRPGEISLAHHGVLFLDELPEFSRHVLETLREPLEAKKIHISRAQAQVTFPANFQLIAAMNPCPCGYAGDISNRCQCSSTQIQHYQAKLSAPFLDRIDLHIEIAPLSKSLLLRNTPAQAESSTIVRERVEQTQKIQFDRQEKLNSYLQGDELRRFCSLQTSDLNFIEKTLEQFNLSARAYDRILKIARTIADLAASPAIHQEHLAEAIGYRRFA